MSRMSHMPGPIRAPLRTPLAAASLPQSRRNQFQSSEYTFCSPQRASKKFSDRIDDYEIKEMLGKGGFGLVHRAVCKNAGLAGKEVAIKMIDKRLMKAANMTLRVANEVEVHWQLHHPSILSLYNYFEDPSYVYLVMELCRNGELYGYIHRRGEPLREEEARGVMTQIVRGVLYLHANGIIHRDLKLSNLLLTDQFDVKIADFGLAVKLSDPDGEQKTMCGTPNYISPEIVSRQPYGLASDVWSLGCMVVTILTGKPPFESRAVKNTLDRVSRVDYSLPDHISPEARDLVNRLLQKDPKTRIPLTKVLTHEFFNPARPVAPLRSLSPGADVKCRRREPLRDLPPRQPQHQSQSSFHYREAANSREPAKSIPQPRPLPTKAGVSSSASSTAGLSAQHPRDSREMKENVGVAANSRTAYTTTSSSASFHARSKYEKPSQSHAPIPDTPHPSTRDTVTQSGPLPTLSTRRLKPLRQKTKHGTVLITESGHVVLDFASDAFLMRIGPDGATVDLVERGNERAGGDGTEGMVVQTYDRTSLPESFAKKYRYAARFVDLVRSKTPKIIFYSPQAKCMLMENAPLADFEMVFYSGTRTHYSVPKGEMEIRMPAGHGRNEAETVRIQVPLDDGGGGNVDVDISPTVAPIVKHVQECLKQCVDVERSGKLEDPGTRFPVILKSSQCRVGGGGGAGSSPEEGGRLGNTRGEQPSFHPSSISTTAWSRQGNGRTPRKGVGSSSASHGEGLSRGPGMLRTGGVPTSTAVSSVASVALSTTTTQSTREPTSSQSRPPTAPSRRPISLPPPSSASSAVNPKSSSQIAATAQLQFKYLARVGWCMKTADNRFVMLFVDGVKMVVDPRDQTLEWEATPGTTASEGGHVQRYHISKSLPEPAKAKLAYFPQFLKLVGATTSISSAASCPAGGTAPRRVVSASALSELSGRSRGVDRMRG
ncbi:hypothetical protein DFS34DRAFT_615441 [Phlyctochytrium arcticum]|nr:hypothetical protein DFS34DRAFT_615441 [Phlyctochytrium arcticum]